MPEGDVVHRTARRLHEAFAGQVLTGADLRWPSLATAQLRGHRVLEVVALGKHLLVRLQPAPGAADQRLTLHSHLRMEGSWWLHRTGQPRPDRRPEHAVRAVLATERWTAVGHRLGMLDLVDTAAEDTLVGHLGPDVLGPGWDQRRDEELVLGALIAQGTRSIGEALLDQRNLAGVGTYFMAEGLFATGVNPWTPCSQVPDLRAVLRATRALLVASDRTGRALRTAVHGRARRPCRRCAAPIRVEPLGVPPRERVAFYCPRCQPAAATLVRRPRPAGW